MRNLEDTFQKNYQNGILSNKRGGKMKADPKFKEAIKKCLFWDSNGFPICVKDEVALRKLIGPLPR